MYERTGKIQCISFSVFFSSSSSCTHELVHSLELDFLHLLWGPIVVTNAVTNVCIILPGNTNSSGKKFEQICRIPSFNYHSLSFNVTILTISKLPASETRKISSVVFLLSTTVFFNSKYLLLRGGLDNNIEKSVTFHSITLKCIEFINS